ncbi:MAG: ribonuclease Z [Thermoplasmata archaeon]|uniref:Ribonuclease Z n=1 Tax=Candidatus Sysuiplasma superficiale TaxID=2823368 RepID=A0A8J7YJL3_9ARCH|nr:ribonuclease Z [Candidatus Sysuiplasma superficiale]MBX8644248.1 ribonuclease Z [Candidatus Sysuiplasma superficiale]MCL4346863.1 ribonuclease Z [Candidatus Thermoplasmatota archaeon]
MDILFLGTAATLPSKKRNVSSTAILLDEGILLFDCGEGTQRQMMIAGQSFMRIRWIAVSHFHGDHILGIPGIVQSMQLEGRKEPMFIIGPGGLAAVLKVMRLAGFLNNTFEIVPVELAGGEEFSFEKYTLKTAEAEHSVRCLAYRLQERDRPGRFNPEKAIELGLTPGPDFGRLQRGESIKLAAGEVTPEMVIGPSRRGISIGYATDTRPSAQIEKLMERVDVLIFDSTFDSSLSSRAMETMHSTSAEAAELAKRCAADRLYLTHISGRYSDPKILRNEARNIFRRTYVASDFMRYTLKHSD